MLGTLVTDPASESPAWIKLMSGLSPYRSFTKIAMPMARLLLRHRLAKGKEDATRIGEREGIALSRPEGPMVWLHAASVGEAQSALILLKNYCRKIWN